MALVAAGSLASCAAKEEVYTITKDYTSANKADMPKDMVNYVLLAYGSDPSCNVNAKLTLKNSDKTYTLYKQLITPEIDDGNGNKMVVMNCQYEFYGTFSKSDSTITLTAPTSGRYNVTYPTILNYQSVEKQTQDWVASADYAALLTRFNKWYPYKGTAAVDSVVTVSGSTFSVQE
jgi:hypothetical protein